MSQLFQLYAIRIFLRPVNYHNKVFGPNNDLKVNGDKLKYNKNYPIFPSK